jgi:nucleotide-binding universal stress UspA family protein
MDMNKISQMDLEKSAVLDQGRSAGPKSILLHVQRNESMTLRLQTALAIARASNAHLTCLHVTSVEAYVAFDSLGGVYVMNEIMQMVADEEAAMLGEVTAALANEDVSWDYRQTTGGVSVQLVGQAALTDLIVVSREPHDAAFPASAIEIIGDVLNRSRAPLLIPTVKAPVCDPSGGALIAWDGSHEAANAVRAATDMLKLASQVHVVQIQNGRHTAIPDMALLEYLSRHGIHAEASVEDALPDFSEEFVVSALLGRAAETKANYLVMGGYSHNRIGEYLFGGVTRTLLHDCPLPLLIAH